MTFLAASICGYLTFCLLFYQGQWQLVLHPTRTTSSPASIVGVPYELIHFSPDESAVPQLTGWWIPAPTSARYAGATILFLPGAYGSLIDFIPTLNALHTAGINVFAFDYRGFGQSAPTSPNQQNMMHDADSAWQYLIVSRSIPARQIVPYGIDVGASLATHLVLTHPSIVALILDSPYADLLDIAKSDSRSRLIPMHLIFHDRFPLAQPLSTLHMPKLLLSRSRFPQQAFQNAARPKVIVELDSPSESLYHQALTHFLDQYVPPAQPVSSMALAP